MRLIKQFWKIVALTVVFICATNSIHADSYPSIQSLFLKGDYLFLDDKASIKMVNGQPVRLKESEHIDVQIITQSPDGDLWGYEGINWGHMSSNGEFPDSYLVRYDGKEWSKFDYPALQWGVMVDLFFPAGKTVAVVRETTRTAEKERATLYLLDGDEFREIARTPEEYSFSFFAYPFYMYVSEDNRIVFSGIAGRGATSGNTKGLTPYYAYSIVQNEWETYYSGAIPPSEIWTKKWDNKGYSETADQKTFTNPKGKSLTLPVSFSLTNRMFDANGHLYLLISHSDYRQSEDEDCEVQLWTDCTGEWKMIACGDRNLRHIAISDDATIWGSDGGTYLAFLRDGKWIEVALLPPVLDGGGPGTCMDPMWEAWGIHGFNMSSGIINDADGYVNVRANPSASASIEAVVLENVTFLYEVVSDNSSWSKVLLPSGTTGYISSNRITHTGDVPIYSCDWITPDRALIDWKLLDECKKEVDEINAMHLTGDSTSTKIFYSDKQGRVRKLMVNDNEQDYEYCNFSAYYNENGQLIYMEHKSGDNYWNEQEYIYLHDGRIVDYGCCYVSYFCYDDEEAGDESRWFNELIEERGLKIGNPFIETGEWRKGYISTEKLFNN